MDSTLRIDLFIEKKIQGYFSMNQVGILNGIYNKAHLAYTNLHWVHQGTTRYKDNINLYIANY